MRTGLVIIGLVILVVGAAVFLTVGLFPPTHSVSTITSSSFLASAPPNGTVGGHAGILPAQPQGAVLLAWQANASVGLQFFDEDGCHIFVDNTCKGTPLVSWPLNSSGVYASASSLICSCYAIPSNPHAWEVGISGQLFVTYPTVVNSLSEASYIAIVLASLILLLIGGLALFLGLFLRGHLFRRPPPPGGTEEDLDPDSWEQDEEGPQDGGSRPTVPRTGYPPRGAG